jgi:hypothetical protein
MTALAFENHPLIYEVVVTDNGHTTQHYFAHAKHAEVFCTMYENTKQQHFPMPITAEGVAALLNGVAHAKNHGTPAGLTTVAA